ncbi:MAG TPA: PDZ domain-containing protein [Planctomycetaceae bacterium]|jgi:membrane-associated protease RseP (regulator of RpoE activity)|nr:PDZ domain-containing protein [Planctomycetaceae bacterium]
MSVRRIVSPVACLTSLFVLSAIPAELCVAGSSTPDAARVALNEVARGLESPAFAVREAATAKLAQAEAPALPVLMAVAHEGNLEAAVRAVGILEAIYVSAEVKGDVAAVDGAESALEELTRTGRPSVADRADVMLESHYDIRERRAVTEIERYHGVPKFGYPGELTNAWNQRLNQAPVPIDRSGDAKEKGDLTWLIIGPKWTGGDEGLKQVARLKRLKILYRIQGCPVSDDGIARLRAAIPGLEVHVRGAAKLGISSGSFLGPEKGCVIQDVQEGEAAANAGLRSQDRIVQFGGHPIENFDSLVELLRNYKPGEVIETIIVRDEGPLKVPLTLTGWD